ncbi:MAG: UDP-N-acetylmuramoyl-tripeptide--D-alanyl-D-alanine ligase [Desulfocucumaceae bacterium]
MFPHTVLELAGAMSAQIPADIISEVGQKTFNSVCTDSRSVKSGDLFFALRGQNSDGHNFVHKAIREGAGGIVADRYVEEMPPGIPIFIVRDTLGALQDLARHNRLRSGVPVVAVTGSSGKTTTKDLIFGVLSEKFCTLKTEGNYNNELGLPLTLLRLDESHQAAVVEMAMRGPGEIALLASIALPDGAVITNIGEAHFERLGSVDNIARAKGELLDNISGQGFAVLHGSSPYIKREALRCRGRVVFYGEGPEMDVYVCQVTPFDGGNNFKAVAGGREDNFFVPLPGRHNVINSLAAIATGLELGVWPAEIRKGLAGARLTSMRLEVSELNGVRIINDSYNANPSSARAALQALVEIAGKKCRKIAVLGDMLELGEKSEPGHREVGACAAEAGVDLLVVVGKMAKYIGEGALEAGVPSGGISHYGSAREAALALKGRLIPGDVILVKGSRGMKMEEFIYVLREDNK